MVAAIATAATVRVEAITYLANAGIIECGSFSGLKPCPSVVFLGGAGCERVETAAG